MLEAENGQIIIPKNLVTPKVPWKNLGSITASQATLAVGARDYSAVLALDVTKRILWLDIPEDVSGVFFRYQTSANADGHVIESWVCPDATYQDGTTEDSFMLGNVLTLTGGQQVGPGSNVFVDTIVEADDTVGVLAGGTILDSAADRVCLYRQDLEGYKKIAFIATTLQAGKTLKVDARWY